MQQSSPLSVGLEVHKDSLAVAEGAKEHPAEVVSRGHIGPRPWDSDTLVRQLQSQSQQLIFVSAAGPCGYWLYRSLTQKGPVCWVIAPSFIPKTPGARVNTHRRDALKLARLMRSGDLPLSTCPRKRMKRCGTGTGRVQRPSALSRPRSFGAKPFSYGRLSVPQAGRPGVRPSSGGSARSSGPRQPNKASVKNPSVLGPSTPNGWSA